MKWTFSVVSDSLTDVDSDSFAVFLLFFNFHPVIPHNRRTSQKSVAQVLLGLDWIGAFIATAGTVLTLVGFNQANTRPWGDSLVLGPMIVGLIIVFGIFPAWCYFAKDPIVKRSLFLFWNYSFGTCVSTSSSFTHAKQLSLKPSSRAFCFLPLQLFYLSFWELTIMRSALYVSAYWRFVVSSSLDFHFKPVDQFYSLWRLSSHYSTCYCICQLAQRQLSTSPRNRLAYWRRCMCWAINSESNWSNRQMAWTLLDSRHVQRHHVRNGSRSNAMFVRKAHLIFLTSLIRLRHARKLGNWCWTRQHNSSYRRLFGHCFIFHGLR